VPSVHGRVDAVPDDATAYIERTARCAGSADIDWYEIQGGGHTWPGGVPYLGPRIVGRVSHELDANEVIWAFVQGHRLD
jgi:poly(3-hydroxybutyrate) depolymerase